MQCQVIKIQQIEKEVVEYSNYDWESFANLTFEEKNADHQRIVEMASQRSESWEFYFNKLPEIVFEDDRLKSHAKKLTYLTILIETLKYVINRMELEIMLLK